MITQLDIRNFKSISNVRIKLKRFNLLCGENASGKTSCIHALLAVLQKKNNHSSLDGDIIRIGTFNELRKKDGTDNIEISVRDSNNRAKKLEFFENPITDDCMYKYEEILDDQFETFEFDKNLFYISSNRNIEQNNPINDYELGLNGQNAFLFLQNHRMDKMPQSYMEAFNKYFPDSRIKANKIFEEHIKFWFEYITGENVNIDFIPYTYNSVLTYGSDLKKRPINTGTGLSSILPIIITCLGAVLLNHAKGGLIIIENPEIFLHPLAQMKLIYFLEFLEKFTQLIIETHSAYILKYVLDKKTKNNTQICVLKVEKNTTNIKYMKREEFKLFPYTFPELLYCAFNIYTIDLHILLFSKLQENANLTSQEKFDKYLLETYKDVPRKKRVFKGKIFQTLPVYIRNCIDHPEQKNPHLKKYKYTYDEMKKSIEFMLSKL